MSVEQPTMLPTIAAKHRTLTLQRDCEKSDMVRRNLFFFLYFNGTFKLTIPPNEELREAAIVDSPFVIDLKAMTSIGSSPDCRVQNC